MPASQSQSQSLQTNTDAIDPTPSTATTLYTTADIQHQHHNNNNHVLDIHNVKLHHTNTTTDSQHTATQPHAQPHAYTHDAITNHYIQFPSHWQAIHPQNVT